MTDERIARLNELARKHKAEGLSPEELEERGVLRQEYIASFRQSLESHLDNIYFVDDAGNKEKLKRKEP